MEFHHCYRRHRFNGAAQETLDRANEIIRELRAQGYTLTLRQLYYQFVRRNWLPNQQSEYKRLGRIVTKAREAGEMDWYAIEDRGRNCYGPNPEEDPAEVLDGIEHGLVFDHWGRQPYYVEVWVEKQALEGVIARPCNKLAVPYMACKGYLSASEAWRAGRRFEYAREKGKKGVLIHLADHDPSGLDMSNDNWTRVNLFAEAEWAGQDVQIRRIALNMDQVREFNPPPNPAKTTDSRAAAYIEEYGHDSWELDALEPKMLDELITETVQEYMNPTTWAKTHVEEAEARKPLAVLGDNWDVVQAYLRREGLI